VCGVRVCDGMCACVYAVCIACRPSFRKILKQVRIRVLRELGGAKVTQKVLLMHGKTG